MRRRAAASLLLAGVAARLLAGCVSAHVNGGPALVTHTSGIAAVGGRVSLGAGLSSPPSWAYANPITVVVAHDLASNRTLCLGMVGAEVRTHPRPWGARVGVHGGFFGWCDSKELNYQVVATGSLLRGVVGDESGDEGTTWSFSWSLDAMVGGTWGDEIPPGLLAAVGLSVAYDWMKGYRFRLNFH